MNTEIRLFPTFLLIDASVLMRKFRHVLKVGVSVGEDSNKNPYLFIYCIFFFLFV